jgi:hypothetical protein
MHREKGKAPPQPRPDITGKAKWEYKIAVKPKPVDEK